MTSGRQPCTECGRNSPKGSHASCRTLAVLRAHREQGQPIVQSGVLSSKVFGMAVERAKLYRAISLLRRDGHHISTIGGGCFSGAYRLDSERANDE